MPTSEMEQKQDELIEEIRKLILDKGYIINDSSWCNDMFTVYVNDRCLIGIEFY